MADWLFDWSRKRELKGLTSLGICLSSRTLISKERIERIHAGACSSPCRCRLISQERIESRAWENPSTERVEEHWSRKRELKASLSSTSSVLSAPNIWSRKRELKASMRKPSPSRRPQLISQERIERWAPLLLHRVAWGPDLARENWKSVSGLFSWHRLFSADLARENWKYTVVQTFSGTPQATDLARENWKLKYISCCYKVYTVNWSRKRELKELNSSLL